MSLDGVSPKGVPPVLTLAASNAKPAEAAPRRALKDELRLARTQRPAEPGEQVETVTQTGRRYPRYVPAANISQLLLDIVLTSVAQASVLFLIYDRLGLEGVLQAATVVSFSVLIILIFLYATGCYRRDAILSTSTAMSRLPVALGFAAALVFAALHYGFPLLYPAARLNLSRK